MTKILVLDGHPYAESYCAALAKEYYDGARVGEHNVIITHLRDLNFDPILKYGYTKPTELENDLKKQQELIKQCEHLVVITPVWWGSTPALLKGYFDRLFLPGFAFKYNSNGSWERLLKGKSARVIYTEGHNETYVKLYLRSSFWRSINTAILNFSGFSPVHRTVFEKVPTSTPEQRQKWLKKVFQLGYMGR